MDNQALSDMMVDLYVSITQHFEVKTSKLPTTDVANTIFIECSKMIMTETIGKQRSGVPSQQKPSGDDKPTDKQMAFAKKLGCHKPEGFSKKELSAWIEEHKEW